MGQNKRNCFLITNSFPYGEVSFLENEVKHLSKHFDNVFIFPLAKKQDSPIFLPDNVKVFPLGANTRFLRKIRRLFRGFFAPQIKILPCSLKERIVSYYSRGQSSLIIARIKKIISAYKLSTDNCIFYSFWFHETAVACWNLSKYYKSKGSNCISISRAHGGDLYDYRSRYNFLPFQETNIIHLDAVFPCSLDGTKYLHSKYPLYKEKIATSYLGTTNYEFKPFKKGEKTVFVTCSYLKAVKRISFFAEAFGILCSQNNNLLWHCFGDGPEREKIQKIVSDNNCQSKVIFHGLTDNQKVIGFYKSNEINYFINVSLSEGLPVSIMEAMSFGIPTIATNVGGTGDLVTDDNGRIIDVDMSASDLANILMEEISLPENEYMKKRENARQSWEMNFSADNNYAEWCKNILNIKAILK